MIEIDANINGVELVPVDTLEEAATAFLPIPTVFIPFHDGSLGKLELIDYDNHGNNHIELISLQTLNNDMEESFKSAADATNLLLSKKGLRENHAFVYRVIVENGKNVVGKSGGLAFSLALIIAIRQLSNYWEAPTNESLQKLLGKFTEACSNVAATGVIKNRNGKIIGVDSLEEKLRGAIQKLPRHSRIFYPQESSLAKSILASIKGDAEKKGVTLTAVETLEEAARNFLPALKTESKLPPWWQKFIENKMLVGVLLCLALFLGYQAYHRYWVDPPNPPANGPTEVSNEPTKVPPMVTFPRSPDEKYKAVAVGEKTDKHFQIVETNSKRVLFHTHAQFPGNDVKSGGFTEWNGELCFVALYHYGNENVRTGPDRARTWGNVWNVATGNELYQIDLDGWVYNVSRALEHLSRKPDK